MKIKHFFIYSMLICSLASCKSVDVQKRVKVPAQGKAKAAAASGAEVLTVPIEVPPQIIEKPVYVPAAQAPPERSSGRAAVEQTSKGILRPSEYSRAAIIYDYHPDWVYELYTQPLRASDIRLKPGEKAVETPFISDSERWLLGAGVNFEQGVPVQHIYVKPVETGLEASLIINTNERVYHLILRSYRETHMPKVYWRYPSTGMPNTYIQDSAKDMRAEAGQDNDDIPGADPRFLSFNYKITYGLFKKPKWLPDLVYDDGKKTYITFPEDTPRTELPAVFENRNDIVNYRVARNVIILDKCIEKISVKIGKREIRIEKKQGK